MKKIIIAVALLLSLNVYPAHAECTENCIAIVDCSTGITTIRSLTPDELAIRPVAVSIPAPIEPTHQVTIQTANTTFHAEGTQQGVTEALWSAVNQSTDEVFVTEARQTVIEVINTIETPTVLMSAEEAYALIDFNADDWLDQFFTWFAEYYTQYQYKQEG